jgi:multidrug efflux system outer membrane protein
MKPIRPLTQPNLRARVRARALARALARVFARLMLFLKHRNSGTHTGTHTGTKMRLCKRSIWSILLLSLCGCMVGPDYHRPETAMPLEFEERDGAEYVTDEELCRWWKQFEDPLLDDLIEEAYRSNYDLRIALEQIVEARAQYQIQGSYLWPEIDLNATAIRSRFSQNLVSSTTAIAAAGGVSPSSSITSGSISSPLAPAIENFFQVGFDAVWELDFFGKFRRGKQAAFDLWEASKEMAQNVMLTVVSEVARDYVAIRALQKQIDLTKEIIWSDEEELALAEVLFKAGLDSQIEVESFISTLDSDSAALPVLETALKTTIYSLAILLGRQPEGLAAKFEEEAPIPSGMDKVPVGLPSDLLRRRPDIRAAERQLAAATEQIGVAVANLFPHISLTGNGYGFESNKQNKWIIGKSRYWSIGPSLNWDLIDFGKTRGQIAVANSLQRQALLTYEQTVISSLQDVEGALVAYFEEQKRTASFEDQVIANDTSFELTRDLFKAGLVDKLQVLEAYKTFLNSENSLVQSQQALTSDLIALYKALGGDWECTSSP